MMGVRMAHLMWQSSCKHCMVKIKSYWDLVRRNLVWARPTSMASNMRMAISSLLWMLTWAITYVNFDFADEIHTNFVWFDFLFIISAKIHSRVHWTSAGKWLWYRFRYAIHWQWGCFRLGFQAQACITWSQFPLTIAAASKLFGFNGFIPFI